MNVIKVPVNNDLEQKLTAIFGVYLEGMTTDTLSRAAGFLSGENSRNCQIDRWRTLGKRMSVTLHNTDDGKEVLVDMHASTLGVHDRLRGYHLVPFIVTVCTDREIVMTLLDDCPRLTTERIEAGVASL